MKNDMWLLNGVAAIFIILGVWWFFNIRSHTVLADPGNILIVVQNGNYQPALVQIPANKSTRLHFLRKDMSACSESLLFPQLNMAYSLPMNQEVEVDLPPMPQGELDFTCEAGTYRGKIIVA